MAQWIIYEAELTPKPESGYRRPKRAGRAIVLAEKHWFQARAQGAPRLGLLDTYVDAIQAGELPLMPDSFRTAIRGAIRRQQHSELSARARRKKLPKRRKK